MKALKTRLAALEGATRSGWDKVHQVIQKIRQTQDQALDEYGRDKIGVNDLCIVHRIVASPNERA